MEQKLDEIMNKLNDIEKRLIKIENRNSVSNKISTSTKISPNKKIIIKKNNKKVIILSGSIDIIKHPNVSRITGDTFDKKHILKEFKGIWTPEIKGWTIKNIYYENLLNKLKETTKYVNIKTSNKIIDNSSITPIIHEDTKEKPLELDFLSDSD